MKSSPPPPPPPPQRAVRWTLTAWGTPRPQIRPMALQGARPQSCCCACCMWPPEDRLSTDTAVCGGSSASQGQEGQQNEDPCPTTILRFEPWTINMPSQTLFSLNPVSVKTFSARELSLTLVIGYFHPDPGVRGIMILAIWSRFHVCSNHIKCIY